MALHLRPKPPSHFSSLRLLSSSPSPPAPPPSDESPPESESESQPSLTSYFSDIKQRLGSPPSPPRRIPTDPLPPPSLFPPNSQTPTASLEDIRKQLASFRLRSASTRSPPSSSSSPISFQELFKNNLQNSPPGSATTTSFDSIRQSLRQSHGSGASFSLKSLQESLRGQVPEPGAPCVPSLIGSDGPLPESIFGREAKEGKEEEGERENQGLETRFLKTYSYHELGEKLTRLRPDQGEKKQGFSLTELNQRLVKLRELEEKESESSDAVGFSVLRESLLKIKNDQDSKKASNSMCLF